MGHHYDPLFLEQTKAEYERLYAERPRLASEYLRQVAERNAINIKTLHRHLDLKVRAPKEKSVSTQLRQEKIDGYAKLVWDYCQRHSFDSNKISVALAFDVLQEQGSIEKDVTVKAVYASMKRLHLRNNSEPVAKRYELKTPMDMWQMDFSKSRYIKHLPNGEVEIRDPRFTKRQDDGMSLWLGVAIDDASRVMYVEYFSARGEKSDEVIDFVLHSFDSKGGFFLQGIPKHVYVDRGSGWLDGRTKKGMVKLGVNEIVGANETDSLGRKMNRSNKKGRGKVERSIRTIKELMEARFYLKLGHGRKMSLVELNTLVREWLEEWNQREHPTRRGEGRWNIYAEKAGQGFANLTYPPDDARAMFSRAIMCTVIKRKIKVGRDHGRDLYALAPGFATDGERVEVIRDQTGYYLFDGKQRHQLKLEGLEQLVHQQPREESKTAMLSDLALRKRFDQELMQQLGLTIARLDEDTWVDLEPFFEKPRSVEDIEEKVAYLKLSRESAATSKPDTGSGANTGNSNIIKLPTSSYVR